MITPLITIYTRHSASCPHKADRAFRRCDCRKWLYVRDESGPRQVSAKTRSWEKADKLRNEMLEEHERKVAAERLGLPYHPTFGLITIQEAVRRFLEDKRISGIKPTTLSKLRYLFDKQLLSWCKDHQLRRLTDITLERLEEFRVFWKDGLLARKKKQERVMGFFHYCHRHGWIKENVSLGLSRIRFDNGPVTLYFTPDEYRRILDATFIYRPRGWTDVAHQQKRLHTFIQVMRWSGMAIGDVATLERSRLDKHDNLFLRRAKTGVPVLVKLPPDVANELRSVPKGPATNPQYFFWSGRSNRHTTASNWHRSIAKVFRIAELENPDGTPKRCFPHMFRDTFAIELLLAGAPLDQVSLLLGHSSVKTTEKHYAPFVRARQEQLLRTVQLAWPKKTKKRTRQAKVKVRATHA